MGKCLIQNAVTMLLADSQADYDLIILEEAAVPLSAVPGETKTMIFTIMGMVLLIVLFSAILGLYLLKCMECRNRIMQVCITNQINAGQIPGKWCLWKLQDFKKQVEEKAVGVIIKTQEKKGMDNFEDRD